MGALQILPSGYGVAGCLSVTDRGTVDDAEAIERALLSAVAQTLAKQKLATVRRGVEATKSALEAERATVAAEREELARTRKALVEGYFGDRPGLEQELADIASLRRMNRDLSETIQIQARQLTEELIARS
jgi:hypothetical protein